MTTSATKLERTIENMTMVMDNKYAYGFVDSYCIGGSGEAKFRSSKGSGYCNELGMSFSAIWCYIKGGRTREELIELGYTDSQLASMRKEKHHITCICKNTGVKTMMFRSFFYPKSIA